MAGRDRIYAALSIQPGEGRRIAWLSLHSLFLGAFVAFYFSTANALFLARFDAAALPAAYVASGAAGYLIVALLARFEKRLSSSSLALSQLGFLIALVTALWLAATVSDSRWTAFALFVAIAPAFTVINLELWGLACRLFDLRQGKRLFGLLGCGEVVSALLGYLLVPLILHFLDDPLILLPFAVAALAVCMLIVRVLASSFGQQLKAQPEARPGAPRLRLAKLGRNRYFLLVAGLTVFSVLANYLVDFSFLSQVRLRFRGSEQVAGFIGIFFAAVKVIELAMRLLAGRLLTRFGLRCGLAALPFTLLLCTAGTALAGLSAGTGGALFFLFIALSKLVWLVLRKSVFDPSLRVLFQPLPEEERLAFQTRVEGLVQQSSTGLAGLLLLVFASAGASSGAAGALRLSGALLPVLAGWLALLGALHREYRARLLQNLSEAGPGIGPNTGSIAPADAGPAAPDQQAPVKRQIEDLAERAAWSMAAWLDLAGEPACAATRESLALDLQEYRRSLFQLLSVLCDPRTLRLVRENLDNGTGSSAIYALEIVDLLVPDDVKGLVLPLVEDLSPAQCLIRLQHFTVPVRLDPPERLGAILFRERWALSAWTKACAAQALGDLAQRTSGAVPRELIASLFHPDPVIQEAAAAAIHQIDPGAYTRHARHLPPADRQRLDRVAGHI